MGKESRKTKKLSKLQKPLIFFLLLALFILAVRETLPEVIENLAKTSVKITLTAALFCCIYYIIEGFVMCFLVRQYESSFSIKDGLSCSFYCSFYRVVTFGSGAGIAGIHYLNKKGISIPEGTGMYMVQYVLHRISVFVFAAIFFLSNNNYINKYYSTYLNKLFLSFLVTLLISIFFLGICISAKFHIWLIRFCNKLDRKKKFADKIGRLEIQLKILYKETRRLAKNKKLLLGVIVADLCKLFFWYSIPFILLSEYAPISLAESLTVTSFTAAIASVIPTPAGIGSTEFVFTMFFTPIVGKANAVYSALLYRFITYIFPCIPGVFAVIFYKKGISRKSRWKRSFYDTKK